MNKIAYYVLAYTFIPLNMVIRILGLKCTLGVHGYDGYHSKVVIYNWKYGALLSFSLKF